MVALYRGAALDEDWQLDDLLAPALEESLGRSTEALLTEDEEMAGAALRIALCTSLERLVQHGALEVSGPGLAESATLLTRVPLGLTVRAFLMAGRPGIRVRLTPLGRWAIREELRAEGAEAPLRTQRLPSR
jgi:hypothetical protein